MKSIKHLRQRQRRFEKENKCRSCGADKNPNRKRCNSCLKKAADYERVRRAAKKNLCQQCLKNKPEVGRKSCGHCKRRHENRIKNRKQKGLCPKCGEPSPPGKIYHSHNKKEIIRRELGICRFCGAKSGKYYACLKCRRKKSESRKRSRVSKKTT